MIDQPLYLSAMLLACFTIAISRYLDKWTQNDHALYSMPVSDKTPDPSRLFHAVHRPIDKIL
jgi:hypothetical protein